MVIHYWNNYFVYKGKGNIFKTVMPIDTDTLALKGSECHWIVPGTIDIND